MHTASARRHTQMGICSTDLTPLLLKVWSTTLLLNMWSMNQAAEANTSKKAERQAPRRPAESEHTF